MATAAITNGQGRILPGGEEEKQQNLYEHNTVYFTHVE